MKREIKDQLRKILRRTVTRKITVRDAYNVFINQSVSKIPQLAGLAPEYQAGGLVEFLIDYYIQTHHMISEINDAIEKGGATNEEDHNNDNHAAGDQGADPADRNE